jgi:hypothetical protein
LIQYASLSAGGSFELEIKNELGDSESGGGDTSHTLPPTTAAEPCDDHRNVCVRASLLVYVIGCNDGVGGGRICRTLAGAANALWMQRTESNDGAVPWLVVTMHPKET